MSLVAETVFPCPLCAKPLVAGHADRGQSVDCPHCLCSFVVPVAAAPSIEKTGAEDPRGLRRVMREVRDAEWEKMRRQLREEKKRTAHLEAELEKAREQNRQAEAELAKVGRQRRGRRSAAFRVAPVTAMTLA